MLWIVIISVIIIGTMIDNLGKHKPDNYRDMNQEFKAVEDLGDADEINDVVIKSKEIYHERIMAKHKNEHNHK